MRNRKAETMKRLEQNGRLASDAGIAIGPILFIIAVLGILAAAIAAGSGSFTTSTSGESNRTKAAAIIEIGQNLLVGFARVVGNGADFADVVINASNTNTMNSMFSPIGGGVAAPSVTMASDPVNDQWYYPQIAITGIGTSAGSRVAILPVTAGVCDEINLKANAIPVTTTPGASAGAAVALGDFADTSLIDDSAVWPLDGKPTGCVKNSDATTGGPGSNSYYFYQVIGVQ